MFFLKKFLRFFKFSAICFWGVIFSVGCFGEHATGISLESKSSGNSSIKVFPPEHQDGQPIIVIDPGHPSEVSSGGGIQNGTTEVKINWEVGLRLEKLISGEPSIKCIKTRNVFREMTTNRRRAEIANESGAALMVRLHCDTGRGSGFTVFYPDRPGSTQGVKGPSEDVIEKSRLAAQCMQEGLTEILKGHLRSNPIKGDSTTAIGAEQGALTGSIFSKVPIITVEMVYLNNPQDAEFIKSAIGQELVAKGLFLGITNFLKKKK